MLFVIQYLDIMSNSERVELLDSSMLKLLGKKVKNNSNSCNLPKKLKQDDYIVALFDNDEIASFIWFGIYENDMLKHDEKKIQYIHINYSYTFEKYRKMGMNKKLRNWTELFGNMSNIKFVVSIPLPEANSTTVLEKMGYTRRENEEYIYYIKEL